MPHSELPALTAPPRVVLFMTAHSAAEIPVTEPTLACLLPFGHATFAERVLDSCSRAGLRQVDLVISDQPEKLRALLGEGWTWGLQLNWHLAKDTDTPYGMVHALGLSHGERVMIGHGHTWIAHETLRAMAESNQLLVSQEHPETWAGWVSLDAAALQVIDHEADEQALSALFLRGPISPVTKVAADNLARAGSAQELLRAQRRACSDEFRHQLPATWRRYPWGAASPDSGIHPAAKITGPVLIGPRCMVAEDANVGPGVVLSHDVLVAGGAVVRDALVLPNTYISANVTLDHVVVQSNALHDLKWSATAVLPEDDGLLNALNRKAVRTPSRFGQVLAAAAAIVTLPAAAVLGGLQVLRGRRAGWAVSQTVTGRSTQWSEAGQLQLCPIRVPYEGSGGTGQWLGAYGGLLDVAQGRRHWMGLRPRDEAQWQALRNDWKLLFDGQPIGLLHAPSWTDPSAQADGEAHAVADAYFTVQTDMSSRWHMLKVLIGGLRAKRALR